MTHFKSHRLPSDTGDKLLEEKFLKHNFFLKIYLAQIIPQFNDVNSTMVSKLMVVWKGGSSLISDLGKYMDHSSEWTDGKVSG